MEVIRAQTAGFCFGVDLALQKLDTLLDAVRERSTIHTLGPIIHNPQVLEEYARLGVRKVSSPDEVPAGEHAVIRAHGIPREDLTRLKERGVFIVDATCPKVKKAQLLIARETERGLTLLLLGERDHPEVRGLLSQAGPDALVFESPERLKEIELEPDRRYFVAAQTTQDEGSFEAVVDHLRSRLGEELTVLHTICDATMRRQAEAIDIAKRVEFMIVVGGHESGNTRRLVKVVEAQGTPCLQVETAQELPLDALKRHGVIGLTAGASTPKATIDLVERVLLEA